MTDKKQPEALRLADEADTADDAGHTTARKANAYYLCLLSDCSQMIRRLHAENETLTLYKSLADEYGLSIFKDLKDLTTEIENLREKLKTYEDLCGAARAPAASVGLDAAGRIMKWSDRVQRAHPKSEPEFWPDALRVKYMADEISDFRAARAPADSVQEDAARYRWLAASCRSTSEHWGGRWSIIIDGPAPKSHDSEDDFDAAVDAARKQGANHD